MPRQDRQPCQYTCLNLDMAPLMFTEESLPDKALGVML